MQNFPKNQNFLPPDTHTFFREFCIRTKWMTSDGNNILESTNSIYYPEKIYKLVEVGKEIRDSSYLAEPFTETMNINEVK